MITWTSMPHPSEQVRLSGFDLRSEYVERCWLAVVGPTTTAMLRLAPLLWRQADPWTADPWVLAQQLGLGKTTSLSGPLFRSMQRMVDFGLAEWLDDPLELGIYATVPPLTTRQLSRLPAVKTVDEQLYREPRHAG